LFIQIHSSIDTLLSVAYWSRSLAVCGSRGLLSGTAIGGCESLDEDTRRLLDDSHLLIASQRLTLLDIIGQGTPS